MSVRYVVIALALVSMLGCEDDRTGGDAGPPGGDAGPPVADAGGGGACAFFDGLDRSCAGDGDCVGVIHTSDCCGTQIARGIATSARAEFDAMEPVCDASYPACGCAAGPTIADSGEQVTDLGSIQVGCIPNGPASVCTTYLTMRPTGSP